MPRSARVLLPGVPLHLIQRGHNKQPCFHGDGDYLFYLDWLRRYGKETGMSLHAYVLMTNHVHLLASFDVITMVSDFMKALGQRYTQYQNHRLGRSGTLWQGRFYSCPVPTERYLITCQRYIELNPVRAGMVRSVDQFQWSSYRANSGLRDDTTISPHLLYWNLGTTAETRHAAYRTLFCEPPSRIDIEELRRATLRNTIPGVPLCKTGRPATVARPTA